MAHFPSKLLGGAGFFEDIRTTMANTGEWLFAGSDGPLNYVVMDALFYGMETIIRPDGSARADFNQGFTSALTFMGYASSLTTIQSQAIPHFRVVVNGNFYQRDYNEGDHPGPNHWWKGQVYKAGILIQPPDKPVDPDQLGDLSFVGRSGQRIEKYHCEDKDNNTPNTPEQFNILHPGSKMIHALGGLQRIVKNMQAIPNLETSDYYFVGKTIFGFHKKTSSIFVVTQEDMTFFLGSNVAYIAKQLAEAGVDAAVKCDSGSSSTLIVDGIVVDQCRNVKNNSTPNGLAFKSANIQLGGPGTSMLSGGRETVTNFNASITPNGGRLLLTITSFGSTASNSDIASSLSIQGLPNSPLILRAPLGGDLRNGAKFTSFPPNSVECFAGLHGDPNVDAIAATVNVMQGTSVLKTASFVWPIAT